MIDKNGRHYISPFIGQIVHVHRDGCCYSAIVVNPEPFPDTQFMMFYGDSEQDDVSEFQQDDRKDFTWHFPDHRCR